MNLPAFAGITAATFRQWKVMKEITEVLMAVPFVFRSMENMSMPYLIHKLVIRLDGAVGVLTTMSPELTIFPLSALKALCGRLEPPSMFAHDALNDALKLHTRKLIVVRNSLGV